MGYALFANRKLYYTNLVFSLQQKLDNIMQQKQSLLNFSANIADGQVTVEEIASDPTNLGNYYEYWEGAQAFVDTADADGGCNTTTGEVGSLAMAKNDSEEYLAAIAEMLNKTVNETYAKQYNKKLEVLENELDMQQQKIETQLSAAQKELEAVKDAEGKAIDNATPKYNGVG